MDASQMQALWKSRTRQNDAANGRHVQGAGAAVTERVDMSTWTDEEIHTLISLWPTSSASQIGARLHRPRSAICGKVMRLRREGALPHGAYGHFDVNPRTPPQRRGRPLQIRILPPKPPPRVRRQPRDAGVFDPRTRRHPLPLAAWQTARNRGAILRRQRGAGPPLLPASSAHRTRLIGAVLAAMPLSIQHRHAVLLADRTHDVGVITTVVTEVLAANPETTPLDIETALRAAFGQAYLVANSTTAGFEIVLGMPAWHAALADAGMTVEQNWAALASRK